MEHLTGLKKTDRILQKTAPLSADQVRLLEKYTVELLAYRPVQYVLEESWFRGLKFYVNEDVLIPRPETEELVEWVVEGASERNLRIASSREAQPFPTTRILDVGTGSGCIAISLKKALPTCEIHACDLSSGALTVARRNATTLETPVQFHQLDFLDPARRTALPPVQVIVSNPPYIPLRDKSTMAPHVLHYEPHMALFVSDQDPLVFYRALAEFGREKLQPGGTVFAETHEELAAATGNIFRQTGYSSITVKKDMQGKDRMIKATW